MILLDINQLAIATIMVSLRLSKESSPDLTTTRKRVLKSVGHYKSQWKHRFGETVICTDDIKYWRREIFPYYKASRKISRASSKFDWNHIHYQIGQIISDLRDHFPIKVLRVEGAEADDIIGSLCAEYGHYGPPRGGEEILVVSGDKDMAQLLRYTNVYVYHPSKSMFVTNMNPAKTLHEHILRGDRGDGIPNFLSDQDTFITPGKKQKPIFETAMADWLNKAPEEFCTEAQLANYRRNELLIDLTKIPSDIRTACVDAYRNTTPSAGSNLQGYFVKNGLASLISDVQQFV